MPNINFILHASTWWFPSLPGCAVYLKFAHKKTHITLHSTTKGMGLCCGGTDVSLKIPWCVTWWLIINNPHSLTLPIVWQFLLTRGNLTCIIVITLCTLLDPLKHNPPSLYSKFIQIYHFNSHTSQCWLYILISIRFRRPNVCFRTWFLSSTNGSISL